MVICLSKVKSVIKNKTAPDINQRLEEAGRNLIQTKHPKQTVIFGVFEAEIDYLVYLRKEICK